MGVSYRPDNPFASQSAYHPDNPFAPKTDRSSSVGDDIEGFLYGFGDAAARKVEGALRLVGASGLADRAHERIAEDQADLATRGKGARYSSVAGNVGFELAASFIPAAKVGMALKAVNAGKALQWGGMIASQVPLSVINAGAGRDASTTGTIADLTGSETLDRLSRSLPGRIAGDVVLDAAMFGASDLALRGAGRAYRALRPAATAVEEASPRLLTEATELPVRQTIRDENGRLRRDLSNVPDEHLHDEFARLAELNRADDATEAGITETLARADYEALPDKERIGRSRRTTDEYGNKIERTQEDLPDADGIFDPDVLASNNKVLKDLNRNGIVRAARGKAIERIQRELDRRAALGMADVEAEHQAIHSDEPLSADATDFNFDEWIKSAEKTPATSTTQVTPPSGVAVVKSPTASPLEAPVVKRAASVIAEKFNNSKLVDSMRRIFAPGNRGAEAKSTELIVRANTGKMAQLNESARFVLGQFDKVTSTLPEADKLSFIHNIETGLPQETPALTELGTHIRSLLDSGRDAIQALGKGHLDSFIENYFPHIWENPDEAKDAIKQIVSTRPLEGPKSFLRQRTIPTLAEGIAAGLNPVTTDPIKLTLLKLREMNRFLTAHRILDEMKEKGLLKFVRATDSAPKGYHAVNDPIAVVRGPLTEEGAATIRGKYYAPEGAARVLNNYLSPGLRGNPIYDAFRGLGNILNQSQLGLSFFHLGFTSMDAIVSKTALGIEQLAAGRYIPALKSFATAPVAPFTTYMQGSKVLASYFGKEGGQEMAAIIDGLTGGGGRVSMDSFYKNNSIDKFVDALRAGRTPGTIGHAIPAFLEWTSKPVLEHIVPRQKLGVFADLMRLELERLGPGASTDAVREAASKVWNSVDNRMGQMVYDNLFWDKTFKDLSMASVRSVGWNLGTIRELGGGVADLATTPFRAASGERLLTHKAAYAIALPISVGMAGAITNYLYTGEAPRELRDYFHPRTGRLNDVGDEERVNLPSYMKDVSAYSRHPWGTIKNKLHPMVAMVGDMLDNRDYYGDLIRNPDDPLVQQLKQEAEFVARTVRPFSIQNAAEELRRGQSVATVIGATVGVTPASREEVRSAAENKMSEYIARATPQELTPEQVAKSGIKGEIRRLVRSGQPPNARVLSALARGEVSRDEVERVVNSAMEPPSLVSFKRLPFDEAYKVYQLGTPAERRLWYETLLAKHDNYVATHE